MDREGEGAYDEAEQLIQRLLAAQTFNETAHKLHNRKSIHHKARMLSKLRVA